MKRWWIKEYRITDTTYAIVAGPRFWTYGGAQKRVARLKKRKTEGVTHEYTVQRVTPDTKPDGTIIHQED